MFSAPYYDADEDVRVVYQDRQGYHEVEGVEIDQALLAVGDEGFSNMIKNYKATKKHNSKALNSMIDGEYEDDIVDTSDFMVDDNDIMNAEKVLLRKVKSGLTLEKAKLVIYDPSTGPLTGITGPRVTKLNVTRGDGNDGINATRGGGPAEQLRRLDLTADTFPNLRTLVYGNMLFPFSKSVFPKVTKIVLGEVTSQMQLQPFSDSFIDTMKISRLDLSAFASMPPIKVRKLIVESMGNFSTCMSHFSHGEIEIFKLEDMDSQVDIRETPLIFEKLKKLKFLPERGLFNLMRIYGTLDLLEVKSLRACMLGGDFRNFEDGYDYEASPDEGDSDDADPDYFYPLTDLNSNLMSKLIVKKVKLHGYAASCPSDRLSRREKFDEIIVVEDGDHVPHFGDLRDVTKKLTIILNEDNVKGDFVSSRTMISGKFPLDGEAPDVTYLLK